MKLQSVQLQLPEAGAAAEFLQHTWRLVSAGQSGSAHYLRGSGHDPYLLSVTEAAGAVVRSVTFSGSEAELAALRDRAGERGVVATEIAEPDEFGGGSGFLLRGPEDQTYRFVVTIGGVAAPAAHMDADTPVQITHVVINTCDLPACVDFATTVLGFPSATARAP